MSASINKTGFVPLDPSHHRLSRYGPVVLWASLIFFASTGALSGANTSLFILPVLHWLLPHASDATINFIHGVVIRKGAHFTEYAIFALLAVRAFRGSSHQFLREHWFVVTFIFVMVYALGDEFHQSFVPSRTASVYDSAIDSFGGLSALCFVSLRWRLHRSEVKTFKQVA
jgi:VanZ family protein